MPLRTFVSRLRTFACLSHSAGCCWDPWRLMAAAPGPLLTAAPSWPALAAVLRLASRGWLLPGGSDAGQGVCYLLKALWLACCHCLMRNDAEDLALVQQTCCPWCSLHGLFSFWCMLASADALAML